MTGNLMRCTSLPFVAEGPLLLTAVLVLFAAGAPSASAAEEGDADDVEARLARMPQPWKESVYRFTSDEYEETLRFWAEKHPEILTVEPAGVSAEGVEIFLMKITDKSIPDVDKQVCLITSLHGGPERSGTTTILHLAEWLLGESPEAATVRRKQVVLLMPINNPFAFFVTDRFGNSAGIDPYTGGGPQNWDLETMTFKAIDKSPEIKAFLSVVDAYRPEVHADVHGIGLQEYAADKLGGRALYKGQTMFEVTGSAYSNYALRPWDWRVIEAMVEAGCRAGYGSDRFEADGQRAFWGPAMQPIADRVWLGRPNFYTAQYAYAKHHTMLMAFEVGWEESGVARLKGLLDIGNDVWEGDSLAGYPVNRLKAFIGHYVTAWGTTADQRRQSRGELWERQGGFSQAMLYPQTEGRDTYIVATTQEAAKLLDSDKATFLANLQSLESVRSNTVEAFVNAGPEAKLYVDRAGPAPEATGPAIEHGMGLRLRIPYRQPKLVDLRLNGHLLEKSPTDGYETWFGNGFTQVEIHVPPEKTKSLGLFIVTCAYASDVKRSYGWEPPQEVAERLKNR
ncbi:MAG: M14 family zinc carboxypeptidase [Planctomycetota bacterium]